MGERILLICDEAGSSDAAIEKTAAVVKEQCMQETYVLKVINHPPMQWCEHGGADSEEEEKILDEKIRRKRGEWAAHEKELHGEKIRKVADNLKKHGVKEVKIKFVQEEINLATTLVNEINEGNYGNVIIPEKIWDKISHKHVVKDIASNIRVITV